MRKGRATAHHSDIPALLLRLALGPMLITHGYNKVKGSGGLEGTTKWFDALGLKPAWVHARLAAATEIGAGTLITIGALNPLPAAAVIGLMTTAAAIATVGVPLYQSTGDEAVDDGGHAGRADGELRRQHRRHRRSVCKQYQHPVLRKREVAVAEGDLHVLGQPRRGTPQRERLPPFGLHRLALAHRQPS